MYPFIRPLASTALLAAFATPGLAGCPTGDDIADGIVLAQNEPFFMRGDFKAKPPEGVVEQRIIESGGQVQESMSLYAHGLVMTGEHSAAGHVEITYVDELTPIDTLPELGHVSVTGIAKGPLGDAYVELDLTFVAHGSLALAECVFETWTVTSTLRDRDGVGASFRLDYAPELDLVLAARALDEASGEETAVYAYQWAGTVADVAR
jgi:hypothetical protein